MILDDFSSKWSPFPGTRYLNRQLWIRGRCCSWACNGSSMFAKFLRCNSCVYVCLCQVVTATHGFNTCLGWVDTLWVLNKYDSLILICPGSPITIVQKSFRSWNNHNRHVIEALIKAGSWWINGSTDHGGVPNTPPSPRCLKPMPALLSPPTALSKENI